LRRRRMSVASAAKGRAADLGSVGWLGFYPEVEARRRGHPRRERGEREGERDLGVDGWMGMDDESTTTSRGVERVI
jgi:hypothetical protein